MKVETSAINGEIPQKVVEIVEKDPYLSGLPKIEELTEIRGGVAHHIYKVRSEGEAYYLKIRGDRFVQVPEIICDPRDIEIEHKALKQFGEVAPENFPRVLSFNRTEFYMVLSNAIPNGEKLEDLFLAGKVTRTTLFNLGATLRKVHVASRPYTEGIREDGDTYKYEELLQHRFGYRHNVVLNELMETLRVIGERQLVLGDAAPKNVGANNNGELFIFFDLETAHKGDTVFDYAYMLGHILLHTFRNPQIAAEALESYSKGYGDNKFDERIVKRTALGIILYRLNSIIPYPTGLTAIEKQETERRIENVLPLNLQYATWPEVIKLLSYEQN